MLVKRVARTKVLFWIAGVAIILLTILTVFTAVVSTVTAPVRGIIAAVDWFFGDEDAPPDDDSAAILRSCLPEANPDEYLTLISSIPDDSDPVLVQGYLLTILTERAAPDARSSASATPSARPSRRRATAASTAEEPSSTPSFTEFSRRWNRDADTDPAPTAASAAPDQPPWPAVPPQLDQVAPHLRASALQQQAPGALAALLAAGRRGTVELTDEDRYSIALTLTSLCQHH